MHAGSSKQKLFVKLEIMGVYCVFSGYEMQVNNMQISMLFTDEGAFILRGLQVTAILHLQCTSESDVGCVMVHPCN